LWVPKFVWDSTRCILFVYSRVSVLGEMTALRFR